MSSQLKKMAQILGRRGGKARAKSLTPERRKEIAALGAKARAFSFEIAKRIESNLSYLDAVHELRGLPQVIHLKVCEHPLPGSRLKHDNNQLR